MAAKFPSYTRSNRRLGGRLTGVLVILLFAIQPGYAGGGGGSSGGGGGGCGSSGGTSSTTTYTPPTSVASSVYNHYQNSLAADRVTGINYTDTLQGGLYVKQLFSGKSNRRDPRLPGYSYFQGLIQANNHITVAGQVRIVGGLLGADGGDSVVSLYNGAMITTNAHSFVGADALSGGPDGVRTRVRKLEEIPTP